MVMCDEPKLCTRETTKSVITTLAIAERICALAEALAEKKFFPYQREMSLAIIQSVLEHDGAMLTALLARQSGKSECIGDTVCALALILPALSRSPLFENDWRFNATDEQGNYRGYKNGIQVGLYAPIQEQADIIFSRVRHALETTTTQAVAKELGIVVDIANSKVVRITNGSTIRARSASEQTEVEGQSYHLMIIDEAQHLSTTKVRVGLHPMVAAYNGTIVKIGTCSTVKGDFYMAIKQNEREFAAGAVKTHFFYDYEECQKYNSFYRDFIAKEKTRLGEDSDEFRLSYKCEWLLERGQFITKQQLMRSEVACVLGRYSHFWKSSDRHGTQVAGIDFGKIHDPTVVTVIDVDWANPVADEWVETTETSTHFLAYKKHVLSWLLLQGDDYESQFAQITEYLACFKGLRKITLDSTGVGQWGADKFRVHYGYFDRGCTPLGQQISDQVEIQAIDFSQKSKSEGYKLLRADMFGCRLTFPASPEMHENKLFRKFVYELLDLRKIYRGGYMMCEAPDEPGAHDDFCVSLMLSCWGAQEPVFGSEVEMSNGNFLVGRRH